LGRNAGHLKFQPSNILTRPGGDHGFGELEVLLPGEYVGEDVRSVKESSLGGTIPARGSKVDANYTDIFASERITAEGAGRGETRRSLGNDLLATT
jgi:hypothetical protein